MHEWLRELRETVLDKYGDVLMVGELPGTEASEVLRYVSAEAREYSCVFDFDVVSLGGGNAEGIKKYQTSTHTLPQFKEAFRKVQHLMRGSDAWVTVFAENHDQGRSLSRFATDDPRFREQAAKMLAALLACLTGTLFLYQGQEIGMYNFPLPSGKPEDWTIEDIKDIDSLNSYYDVADRFDNDPLWCKKALAGIQRVGRDNARTPVQWDDSPNAGFSTAKPWMRVHDDYKNVNVKKQQSDPNSPLSFWKKMLKLRKQYSDLCVFGDFEIWDKSELDVFTLTKTNEVNGLQGQKLVVFCSFSDVEQPMYWPEGCRKGEGAELLISNLKEGEKVGRYLTPWEARVYLVKA